MATHSSILAWKIPWTEGPSRLQSMGPQRVRHDTTERLHFLSVGITVQSNQKVPVNKGKFLHSEECHFMLIKRKRKNYHSATSDKITDSNKDC